MYLKKLRILNYKGFRDSGWLEFGPGFNVVIGQNNSGKTAILECVRLQNGENKPHKNIDLPRNFPLDQASKFEFDLSVCGSELIESVQRTKRQFVIPKTHGENQEIINFVFYSNSFDVKLLVYPGSEYSGRVFPSFDSRFIITDLAHTVGPSISIDKIDVIGTNHNPKIDQIPQIINAGLSSQFYFFKAERLNIGTYPISDEVILMPNAANLPAVIANLTNRSPSKTQEFNQNVTSIFPSIKLIQAPNVGNQYRIRIWNSDPDTDRDDLAAFLEDSGSGIGQVLAILYVAMTMPPSVIAIDEPNSFLHPGATKKLLQILKQYKHQYIISTHSTDIISSVEPDTLHLVQWRDGESRVTALDASEVSDMRIVLNEVGIGLSDVFAADQVVWVEGQTEQECFPRIVRHRQGQMPLGLSFLAVIDTGDFEAKDWKARKIWQLYKRLGSANGILPVAVAFSLDSEERTDDIKQEMKKETGGVMHFLPRRAYENYLLSPSAIVAVINPDLEADKVVSDNDIKDWIKANGKDFHPKKTAPDDENWDDWVGICEAAKLLHKLFGDISHATVEYRKTQHSIALTDWLLENSPDTLKELIDYVMGLLPKTPST
jgi:AAA domain, putative AbiEii toxin, Type IV TA system/AAA ATPase domain